ncbi:competence type IV pilus minor pilin ComGG [Sediminibacillus massiliensis]|uniref:competence type IV pilus minor pilin ComGG n=1 Tax=Sediminibacillus massiliensis TaxID=1926277 RepID=UPI0009885712|nr:competence type IV pilus minor pilin ComGG [Sediminibacillus massiliensis]
MKKPSAAMNRLANNNGYFFPFIAGLAVLTLFLSSTAVSVYKNNLEITYKQTEQLIVDNLLEMGMIEFIEETENHALITDQTEFEYDYPTGKVTIEFFQPSNAPYHLKVQVTSNQGTVYHTEKDITFLDFPA